MVKYYEVRKINDVETYYLYNGVELRLNEDLASEIKLFDGKRKARLKSLNSGISASAENLTPVLRELDQHYLTRTEVEFISDRDIIAKLYGIYEYGVIYNQKVIEKEVRIEIGEIVQSFYVGGYKTHFHIKDPELEYHPFRVISKKEVLDQLYGEPIANCLYDKGLVSANYLNDLIQDIFDGAYVNLFKLKNAPNNYYEIGWGPLRASDQHGKVPRMLSYVDKMKEYETYDFFQVFGVMDDILSDSEKHEDIKHLDLNYLFSSDLSKKYIEKRGNPVNANYFPEEFVKTVKTIFKLSASSGQKAFENYIDYVSHLVHTLKFKHYHWETTIKGLIEDDLELFENKKFDELTKILLIRMQRFSTIDSEDTFKDYR